jgi:hypothetical protein
MSKKSHNKKRNVGIIYEQLVLKLSKALVENDKKTFRDTKKIIKKYFKKDSELYKEHRLVNSLADFQTKQNSVIPVILEETKKATWRINERRLDREKSRLIRDINETFGRSFYSARVSNYRDLATIDLLLQEYKKGSKADHARIMEYSDKVTFILTKEKPRQVVENMKTPEINSLVVNIMREKFSKAYSKNLSKAQISIINEWVLNGHSEAFLNEMKATKLLCLDVLNDYKNKCSNKFISNNLKQVHENVLGTIFEGQINESHVIKVMTMQDIIKELSGSNENE